MRPTMRPAEEFRTPLPSAKWQDGDGEGDSPEGSGGLEVQGTGAEGDVGVVLDVLGEVEEESEDEVEYMPPKPDGESCHAMLSRLLSPSSLFPAAISGSPAPVHVGPCTDSQNSHTS